jgi:hypothetical protein
VLLRVFARSRATAIDIEEEPSERDRPLPFVRTHITLGEYVGEWFSANGKEYSPSTVIPMLLRQHPRDQLLAELAFLGRVAGDGHLLEQLIAQHRGH